MSTTLALPLAEMLQYLGFDRRQIHSDQAQTVNYVYKYCTSYTHVLASMQKVLHDRRPVIPTELKLDELTRNIVSSVKRYYFDPADIEGLIQYHGFSLDEAAQLLGLPTAMLEWLRSSPAWIHATGQGVGFLVLTARKIMSIAGSSRGDGVRTGGPIFQGQAAYINQLLAATTSAELEQLQLQEVKLLFELSDLLCKDA